MKQSFYLLVIALLVSSCKDKERIIEEIEFSTVYKFSYEIEEQVLTDTIPWKYQISAADYAKKSDYKNALIHWDLEMPTYDASYAEDEIDSINSKYAIVNAVDFIIK